jgi:hypothetical protein
MIAHRGRKPHRPWKSQLYTEGAKKQGYLFNTGSSLDWAIAKNKIQTAFQAAGVWEYVYFPPPAVPLVAPPGGGPIVLPELTLAQPEPTHANMVDNKIARYDASVIARYNSVATIVAISGLDEDEELRKNIDNELKRVEDKSKRPQVLEKYEEEFIVGHTAWLVRKEKDELNVSKVISTFQSSISPSSLSVVIDLIQGRRFRQAWSDLNEHFSANVGGRESRSAMLDILVNATWNGTDFNGHVNYMSTLYDEVTEGGFDINDEMKYEYLKKSILRGPNRIFNSILEYADYADDHDYASLLAKLQVKFSATELNEHRDRSNENGLNKGMRAMQIGSTSPESTSSTMPPTQNNSIAKKRTHPMRSPRFTGNQTKEKLLVLSASNPHKDHQCNLCGKKGHLESKCFSVMTCEECNKVGHPAFLCPNKIAARSNNIKTNNKVKLADAFGDKYPKNKRRK